MSPLLLAVGLVAGGALALEVLLTRILAIVHWHHFAGMVISLALLGYGASGSALTPLLDRLHQRPLWNLQEPARLRQALHEARGGGIRQREINQGMVLLCCSKPLTDLVVDR